MSHSTWTLIWVWLCESQLNTLFSQAVWIYINLHFNQDFNYMNEWDSQAC